MDIVRTQLIVIGTIGGKQGFAMLTRSTGGIYNTSWSAAAYERCPTAINGIAQVKEKHDLRGPDDPGAEKVLSMVQGDALWYRQYRCAAKIADDLGWA